MRRSLIFIFLIFITYGCGSSGSSSYSWQTGSWGVCSNDIQSRTVTCQSSTGYTVADSYCSGTKPLVSQSCTVTYAWETGDWGVCSSNDTQSRTVTCQSSYGATVADSNCTETKPATSQSCTLTYSWQTGDWGVCSNDIQSRTVTCQSSYGATVVDSNCTETKPAISQICSEITNTIGMKLVLVEKGSFEMGSTSGNVDASPIHTVNITKDFYVGKYEVTQGEWEAVMVSNPSYFLTCGAKCPVEQVSKANAQIFITKLNEKEGTDKYRLLTEAEWEYVARGGNKSKGYTYSGSNTIDDVAWYKTISTNTQEVGKKSPNELGIYDMSGNVWERVQDYYSASYYSSSPTDDPVNTTSGTDSQYVLRGGSWFDLPALCLVVHRGVDPSDGTYRNVGFRLAKSLSIYSDKTSLDFSPANTTSVSFKLINDYPTGVVVQKIEIPLNFSLTVLNVNDILLANSTKSVTCTYNGNGFPDDNNSFIKIYFEGNVVISIIIKKP